ncbi:MAG: hypothetical protein M3P46_06425 [Actinomycetota bacterium]|nr:hypothetical protein [Actinomycetota bacterium]
MPVTGQFLDHPQRAGHGVHAERVPHRALQRRHVDIGARERDDGRRDVLACDRDGSPTTAASLSRPAASSTRSTSAACTLRPPRRTRSSARPVTVR